MVASVCSSGMLYCSDVSRIPPYIVVAFCFLIALAAWQYGNQVWKGHPGDLLHRWIGSRELLLNGRNPYSQQVSEEIQIGLTGHKYDPRRDAVEQRFYYPVYVVFLMAPTIRLPFPLVKKIFSVLLLLFTALTVPLWLDFLQWRLTVVHQIALVVLSVCSMAALQGVFLQNLGLLVSALLAAACFALRRNRFIVAGPLLALATIKPHLVAPLIACLFLWTMAAWKERRSLMWSFVLSISALTAAGELLLPGWVTQCLRQIIVYPEKSFGVSPLQLMFTRPVGLALAVAVIFGTLYLAWVLRRATTSSPQFAFMMAMALAVTLAVIPSLVPYSDLQLLPGILLLVKWRRELCNNGRRPRYLHLTTLGLVLWPYLAMLLLLALRLSSLRTHLDQRLWELPLAVMPLLPLFVVATLGWAGLLALHGRTTLRQSTLALT